MGLARIPRKVVPTPSLAPAQRAYPFQVAQNLRLDMRTVQIKLLQPPGQQIIRPFPGKDAEIRGANGQVVRDAPIELRYISPSAIPISPPLREPSKRTGPFTGLDRAVHGSLHFSMPLCLVLAAPRSLRRQVSLPCYALSRRNAERFR